MITLEKIERMLKIYRAKLETVSRPPADYAECLRVSAQISLLEDLYYYALQEAGKPAPAANP